MSCDVKGKKGGKTEEETRLGVLTPKKAELSYTHFIFCIFYFWNDGVHVLYAPRFLLGSLAMGQHFFMLHNVIYVMWLYKLN